MAEFPSYTSFYRRFRPQRFSEVLGQGHVTTALRNAISHDRVSHAYLFSGPRGTGKTSTARILAKALNCLAPSDGEPCCECSSCISIADGRSFDVVELDAASNSGVDAIRSLIAQTPTGTLGKWKVYIVDEVHMLSPAAANALLKTLEEPPSHVVFVLATTDPQKVIPTIKSRSQHYEFHLLDESTLEELILSVKDRAELNFDDSALGWLLNKGGGSARDTLSYLDQVVALGYVPDAGTDLEQLFGALAASDTKAVMGLLDSCLRSGQDSQRICADLVGLLRTRFLDGLGTKGGDDTGTRMGAQWLVRAMSLLGESLVEMRDSLDPRVILEVALVRIVNPAIDPAVADLTKRVDLLEQELARMKLRQPSDGPALASPPSSPTSGTDRAESAPQVPHTQNPSRNASELRERIAGAPSPSQLRSKDDLARLKTAVSGAKASGASSPVPADREKKSSESESDEGNAASIRSENGSERSGPVTHSDSSMDANDGGGLPSDAASMNRIYKEEILATLARKARSRFAAARVAEFGSSRVVLSVPNEAHRERAVEYLAEVSKAFSNRFPRSDLTVELTSDDKLVGGLTAPVQEVDSDDELIEQFSSAQEVTDGDAESRVLDVFPGAQKLEF